MISAHPHIGNHGVANEKVNISRPISGGTHSHSNINQNNISLPCPSSQKSGDKMHTNSHTLCTASNPLGFPLVFWPITDSFKVEKQQIFPLNLENPTPRLERERERVIIYSK